MTSSTVTGFAHVLVPRKPQGSAQAVHPSVLKPPMAHVLGSSLKPSPPAAPKGKGKGKGDGKPSGVKKEGEERIHPRGECKFWCSFGNCSNGDTCDLKHVAESAGKYPGAHKYNGGRQ